MSHCRLLAIPMLAGSSLIWVHHFAAAQAGSGGRCLVISDSTVEAFREATKAARPVLSAAGCEPWELDVGRGPEAVRRVVALGAPRLVLTFGAEAHREARGLPPGLPVVSAMLLQADEARTAPESAAAVYLDVPPAQVLRVLNKLFPGKTRLGVILGPAHGEREEGAIAAAALRERFTLATARCRGAEELLSAFESLAGKADFVLALPDSSLYNAATVKPLILASLAKRLPILGFSQSFVRAGAAAAIYADFAGVGVQAAEMAKRILEGEPVGRAEAPREIVAAVNQRVLRLLGLDCRECGGRRFSIVR